MTMDLEPTLSPRFIVYIRNYLSSTNLTLSEIAFEPGYSELSAFSRAFRSRAGETQQVYRDKLKQFIRA
jgi:transcriptional regulator GlxA family with amidase domain